MGSLLNLGASVALLLTEASVVAQTPELLLFGGRDHDVFLGCLNCGHFDASSVCNRYSPSGSQFSSNSIWNRFGPYGSQFSPLSPWNTYASDPPVVVDRSGGFYGYFTANRFHPKRTTIPFFLVFLDHPEQAVQDLEHAQDVFCGDA